MNRRPIRQIPLGINENQIAVINAHIDTLERLNDAIGLTPIRHAVSKRLVEVRLLLRDGHLDNMNGGASK